MESELLLVLDQISIVFLYHQSTQQSVFLSEILQLSCQLVITVLSLPLSRYINNDRAQIISVVEWLPQPPPTYITQWVEHRTRDGCEPVKSESNSAVSR